MVVIFVFSSQTGTESEKLSGGVQTGFESAILRVIGTGEFQTLIFDLIELFLRKGAHLFLYSCLGFFVSAALKSYKTIKKHMLVAIVFCFLYAVSDEAHQNFVEGRNAAFTDVCIDTVGAAAGIYICGIVENKKRPRGKRAKKKPGEIG